MYNIDVFDVLLRVLYLITAHQYDETRFFK